MSNYFAKNKYVREFNYSTIQQLNEVCSINDFAIIEIAGENAS